MKKSLESHLVEWRRGALTSQIRVWMRLVSHAELVALVGGKAHEWGTHPGYLWMKMTVS